MAIVTIHQAKSHFSQLIQRVLAGEEIIVSKGNEPVVKVVPIPEARKERMLGGAKGIVKHISDDFDAPLKPYWMRSNENTVGWDSSAKYIVVFAPYVSLLTFLGSLPLDSFDHPR